VEVLLDGGVRRGGDVVTALALGASAVMIGRWSAPSVPAPPGAPDRPGRQPSPFGMIKGGIPVPQPVLVAGARTLIGKPPGFHTDRPATFH
jgi:hypothetical protein